MAQVNPLNLATPAHKYHKLPPLILHPFAELVRIKKSFFLFRKEILAGIGEGSKQGRLG